MAERSVQATITLDVELDTDGDPGGRVTSAWTWTPAEPCKVAVLIITRDGETIPWVFGRQLLIEGVVVPAGAGDVRMWTDGARLKLVFINQQSRASAQFSAPLASVSAFLTKTLEATPLNAEQVDVDSALVKLLAGSDG